MGYAIINGSRVYADYSSENESVFGNPADPKHWESLSKQAEDHGNFAPTTEDVNVLSLADRLIKSNDQIKTDLGKIQLKATLIDYSGNKNRQKYSTLCRYRIRYEDNSGQNHAFSVYLDDISSIDKNIVTVKL